jgi:hypothetical protein
MSLTEVCAETQVDEKSDEFLEYAEVDEKFDEKCEEEECEEEEQEDPDAVLEVEGEPPATICYMQYAI